MQLHLKIKKEKSFVFLFFSLLSLELDTAWHRTCTMHSPEAFQKGFSVFVDPFPGLVWLSYGLFCLLSFFLCPVIQEWHIGVIIYSTSRVSKSHVYNSLQKSEEVGDNILMSCNTEDN